ncbi:hypothetical protein KBB85_05470, partial [Patescibacteria group bacterium]|nr:hypothetical protein [Patescibacteria group bacterium]
MIEIVQIGRRFLAMLLGMVALAAFFAACGSVPSTDASPPDANQVDAAVNDRSAPPPESGRAFRRRPNLTDQFLIIDLADLIPSAKVPITSRHA